MSCKSLYKFARHPAVFFTIGIQSVYLFVMRFNVLLYLKHPDVMWILLEQIINNIGVFFMFHLFYQYDMLYHYLFAFAWGYCLLGVTFHWEHTFNPCYVTTNDKWKKKSSGIHGSSFIEFPWVIKYFWGCGEAYHHVHHMNAKIPFYNLKKYHEEVISKSRMFDDMITLSMSDCYQNLWLVLYDEERKRYITFAEADKQLFMKL